ncbi:MAG TPA: DNA repair protein RecO [Dongiaceae bacterium]|nr:DNA repair protein RecO [Dongiaceae bacterium]
MTINEPDYGYLLHARPLRDTSLIGEFFLRRQGRIAIVYKHLKKEGKQGAKARLLQPFVPLAVSFDGQQELKSGRLLEAAAASLMLAGTALFSGFYLNELLVRLLQKEEALPELFTHYEHTLRQLQDAPPEIPLRQFEHQLLRQLGYELVLDQDTNGDPVQDGVHYRYEADSGFIRLPQLPRDPAQLRRCFAGSHLLEIHRQAYEDSAVRAAAKQLSRLALAPHLGDKPLHSRELFAQLQRR